MSELLPCNCTSTDLTIYDCLIGGFHVDCGTCGKRTGDHKTRQKAIEAWNRRIE